MMVEMKKLAARFEPKLQQYFASLAFDYVLHSVTTGPRETSVGYGTDAESSVVKKVQPV